MSYTISMCCAVDAKQYIRIPKQFRIHVFTEECGGMCTYIGLVAFTFFKIGNSLSPQSTNETAQNYLCVVCVIICVLCLFVCSKNDKIIGHFLEVAEERLRGVCVRSAHVRHLHSHTITLATILIILIASVVCAFHIRHLIRMAARRTIAIPQIPF